jgi:hypothetical protein
MREAQSPKRDFLKRGLQCSVVGCALGLRHVLASISVEGVIAAQAAIAEQQTDEGAASKLKARPVQ